MEQEPYWKKQRIPIEIAIYTTDENIDAICQTLKRLHYLVPRTLQEPYWKIIKFGDDWVDVNIFIRQSIPFEETADIVFLEENLPTWIESYYKYCYKKCGAPLISPDINRELKRLIEKHLGVGRYKKKER